MFNFLFWNLNRRPISDLVAELAREYEIDVIILAECDIDSDLLVKELRSTVGSEYSRVLGLGNRIRMYVRFDPDEWINRTDNSEYAMIQHIVCPDMPEFLLVAAHMPSKLYATDQDQLSFATRLRETINRVEDKVGHARTVIVGDLNMNPFEAGVASSEGLHGVMQRDIASRGNRIVSRVERRLFYNPLWGYFGDRTAGPPGTYYYNSSSTVAYFWNIFDQVLFSADLMYAFDDENLEIVTAVGETSLLNDLGRPNSAIASDHFPIVFGLDFT